MSRKRKQRRSLKPLEFTGMDRKEAKMSANIGENKQLDGKFYISLPIPRREIINILVQKSGNELALERYFATVKEIGQMESQTLKEVAKIKFGFFWKVLLIVSVLITLIVGMALGVTLKGSYDKFTINAQPPVQSTAK